MNRTSFTDEQIIGIPARREACAKCGDMFRKHGVEMRCLWYFRRV